MLLNGTLVTIPFGLASTGKGKLADSVLTPWLYPLIYRNGTYNYNPELNMLSSPALKEVYIRFIAFISGEIPILSALFLQFHLLQLENPPTGSLFLKPETNMARRTVPS